MSIPRHAPACMCPNFQNPNTQLRPSSCMMRLAINVRQQQKSAAVSACISGLQVTLAN